MELSVLKVTDNWTKAHCESLCAHIARDGASNEVLGAVAQLGLVWQRHSPVTVEPHSGICALIAAGNALFADGVGECDKIYFLSINPSLEKLACYVEQGEGENAMAAVASFKQRKPYAPCQGVVRNVVGMMQRLASGRLTRLKV